jgi:hypothetical protein
MMRRIARKHRTAGVKRIDKKSSSQSGAPP